GIGCAVATVMVDGRPIAVTASWDRTVRVWDLTTGHATHSLIGHTGIGCAVATVMVDGRPIAVTASWDRTVRVWDLITGSCLTTLTLPHRAQCVEISADATVVLGMGYEVIVLTLEPVFRRLR
ncbi:hypothetical protein ACFRFN_43020, partial [Streptomyces mirabilis]